MEGGRNRRDEFFGFQGPFAGFSPFGRPGSLMSGFFGGRDPFADPFFTRPFGSSMGPGMFGPGLFGPMGRLFGDSSNAEFLEQAPPPSSATHPIIRELAEEEGREEGKHDHKDGSNNESFVQEPDEENEERLSGQMQQRPDFNRANTGQSQARTFTLQSSSVTYGGVNGAYYTSSRTRRTGSDGVAVEECKEADTTTRKATHRMSRGIHDKGHSVTRRLNSDGRVDTVQTLHNLNEDELAGFEEAWEGNARQHLPGWNSSFDMRTNENIGNHRSSNEQGQQFARAWALPGTGQTRRDARTGSSSKSRIIPIS